MVIPKISVLRVQLSSIRGDVTAAVSEGNRVDGAVVRNIGRALRTALILDGSISSLIILGLGICPLLRVRA
jgi:hypothetical protein